MNEQLWHKMFRGFIGCYEAIGLLADHNILDEEERQSCDHNLLDNIIETFRSEVEE